MVELDTMKLKEKILELLEKPESSILDFKEKFYDFNNDKDSRHSAKFVKDVISFSNTIRTENGLILFGVQEKHKNSFEMVGLNYSIDDSILQEKIKNKVFPRPFFSYKEVVIENKRIGILEFPISKYELPITASVKMKGIETGKVYYRSGSSNTEANAIDTIRINDWFKSLPGNLELTLTDKISDILKRLSSNEEKLSIIIVDLLNIARVHKLKLLEDFCSVQMTGLNAEEGHDHSYRMQNVYISTDLIKINHYSSINATVRMVKDELEKSDRFHELKLFITHPITKIEEDMILFEKSLFGTLTKSSRQFFGKGEDYEIHIVLFGENFRSLYSNIRQRVIDEVMKL